MLNLMTQLTVNNQRSISLMAALTTLSLLGCSDSRENGGMTPGAAFEKFKSAEVKEDYRTAYSQTTTISQQTSLGNCVIWISMMEPLVAPTKWAELQKLYAKYDVKNVDLQQLGLKKLDFNDLGRVHQQIVGDVQDKTACIGEVFPWMYKNCPNRKTDAFAQATLVGVKSESDHASGTIEFARESNESPLPVKFERISGRWFIDWTTNPVRSE